GRLDRAEIRAVDAALMRERFLSEPTLGAEPAHILRQIVSQGSFVRPLHRRASCPLTFLRRPPLSYILLWTGKAFANPQCTAKSGQNRNPRGGKMRLTEHAGTILPASCPGVLPDNRVIS